MINSLHNVFQALREKESAHPEGHLLRARPSLPLADVELLFVCCCCFEKAGIRPGLFAYVSGNRKIKKDPTNDAPPESQ